jgi:hypothetical protein
MPSDRRRANRPCHASLARDVCSDGETVPDNARRVWQALALFGAPLRALGISETDFTTPDIVAQLGLPPNRIDILTGVSGLTFDEAWDDRLEHCDDPDRHPM